MPDWKQIVRGRVRALRVCPAPVEEALLQEWAHHLEDTYEICMRDGLSPDEAHRRSLDQVRELGGVRTTLRILREVLMNGFTRQVALPGVLAFALGTIMGAVLDLFQLPPKTILFSNGLFLSLPIPLLFLLPFCGAVGAHVSRRNGGLRWQRICAVLFLPAIMSTLFSVIAIAAWALSRWAPDYGWSFSLVVRGLALWLTGHALLPAISLLLGATVEAKLISRNSGQRKTGEARQAAPLLG